ncbi:SUKH-4 family immunity protein [Streptomyces sp. TRM 70351]|uniref:SUKH-4 family immunity protein n=1 Tax=Streptomyces sp. TRM 70351 TaxID=3116552 RepID=UPI002E7ACE2A|nr:SUKH-4 family immunity protein [Streptomyces sp. TRM 70351]MEE1929440.1 SUKH-4 family immunity protein [Streptomyces sp. TRM 70351]
MSAVVTFAQAQERAERWVNEGVPAYQRRRVQVREFDLGFVAWAEDREDGPRADGGRTRLVIARDSGESTLWPGLPVGEVIRRYEEEYGARAEEPAVAAPRRVDLEATSFLLTPPEWLQEAADRLGLPDGGAGRGGPEGSAVAASAGDAAAAAPPAGAPEEPDASGAGQGPPVVGGWADTSDSGQGESLALPETVPAAPPGAAEEAHGPRPAGAEPATELMPEGSALPRTRLSPAVPEPQGEPSAPEPGEGAAGPGEAGPESADTVTGRAAPAAPPRPSRGGGPAVPPPPGAPGVPGVRQPRDTPAPGVRPDGAPSDATPSDATPPAGAAPEGTPGGAAGGYVPTQLVPADGPGRPGSDGGSGTGGSGSGGVHQAATMLSGPAPDGQGAPGGQGGQQPPVPPPAPAGVPGQQGRGGGPAGPPPPPGPPGRPGQPGGGVHHAATMLAGPGQHAGPAAPSGPGTPPPPQPPPGVRQPPPGAAQAPPGAQQPPPAYGYPQQPGVPMVGPGYMAVLRYRAPDGSEQQLIRRSAPGLPHPEWQVLYELRALGVPPQQVIELHTELEPCDLPGGYCARMIRETWPQVRVSHTAAYGSDHGSRQRGMHHLLVHQGELHQVADGPARPAPVRAPLQPVPQAPPVPPEGVGHELLQAFGPQGVFRFDQRAVSRQGVPDVVAQTLVWAGLPLDFGPFFWAQAQPGRPVPTLAELAQERGVQPGPDAGSYLVMGSDFGRQVCVQYGTAHIVAVPLEAAPDGQPAPAQFVNSGLPEFARCLAMAGRMWRLRYGLTPDQAGRWTVDFQQQLAALDPAALAHPENWWSVLVEQMWDGLL